jgi:hypothetical protein
MRRQAKMLLACGAALVMGVGAAHADERQKAKAATPEQAGREAAAKEISGRVVQASPSRLFLEHMGAVVEFRIASDAQFSGGDVRSSSDLSQGQEVRASFTVENGTTNVAKRISLTREAGSAGPPHGGTGSATEPKPESGAVGAPPSERPIPQERVPGKAPGERAPSDPGTPAPPDPGMTPPLKQ